MKRQRLTDVHFYGLRRVGAVRGSVTAELAVVLPAVTVLVALLMLSVAAGMLQLRLEEGARAGARALARGDSSAQVLELVATVAGGAAVVSLGSSGGYATVTVQGRVGGVLSGLVPWTQSAQANARVESTRKLLENQPAAGPSPGVDSDFGAMPVLRGFAIHKSSLWRWARTPECPIATGQCSASAMSWRGALHVHG
ncbi:TadE family type IV pilus minor pilin [Arthrobacter sp.]|uniref:TadE family type IV pilus minor pilin n=1 Tax=Arthrobacter sp. TaxID=1667 RepID=UPI0026DF1159|nr:TadE family type IV pilus minor pilin [Arthrobacter sp.]MDO5753397.1 TadE family type IV pilus minor pilin [Arthrobacter sp.]